ncbi:hypothetical protein H1P_2820004 [Hyella patelloides LEGE 07179]|uniref:Uncharacterized protein n=1 Tax=Hyella patelloides LEGE 07179 TaxID=945734 RepID=A0A563VTL4_9CYAN|nr:hypothetical protein H1P_2820004 [Hyella patelloides LEGE 07179]
MFYNARISFQRFTTPIQTIREAEELSLEETSNGGFELTRKPRRQSPPQVYIVLEWGYAPSPTTPS